MNAILTLTYLDPQSAPMVLSKLQSPVKQSLDKVDKSLKDIHKAMGSYSKSLNSKFKDKPLPFAENDALTSNPSLINRAIAMHLLREGHFDVAATFINEANSKPPPPMSRGYGDQHEQGQQMDAETVQSNGTTAMDTRPDSSSQQQQRPYKTSDGQFLSTQTAWEADFAPNAYKSASLQRQFLEMYHILDELRTKNNLTPAIEWARQHSAVLEARGSNLEYDLCRLQYVQLFTSPEEEGGGCLAAIRYARETFSHFPPRYASQTFALLGALAYTQNLQTSPYASLFTSTQHGSTASPPLEPGSIVIAPQIHHTPSPSSSLAAQAFTSEFCALLSLSSASPLLTCVTAGCIALPTLLKLSQIQQLHRTSWTTAQELPVEIPNLPKSYQFHSIFVCPVSKEQSTDANPPMMLPCGHVIARESMERLGKGTRFKCPYCPVESFAKDARMVFL